MTFAHADENVLGGRMMQKATKRAALGDLGNLGKKPLTKVLHQIPKARLDFARVCILLRCCCLRFGAAAVTTHPQDHARRLASPPMAAMPHGSNIL